MSALTNELEQTLKELDEHSALALERQVRDAITLARPAKPNATTALDAKGWPLGYFEKYAGCLAGITGVHRQIRPLNPDRNRDALRVGYKHRDLCTQGSRGGS